MAISTKGRLAARRTAPFHIQMALETRAVERGRAQIAGKVVRVFRTDGRLAEGSNVGFEIWVCQPGDEPTGPAYIYADTLAKASFLEAYLRGTPPACELAAYEFTAVDAPTDQPVLNPAELEELLKERYPHQAAGASAGPNHVKWWQFWRTNRGA
jgi:hypothetical protein